MSDMETLTAGTIELRENGAQLRILALSEGRPGDSLLEVFTPGSLSWSDSGIPVRCRHLEDAGSVVGFPTRVNSEIRVQVRPSPELRERVQAGAKYASIEFHALTERRTESGIREVSKALLVGVTLTSKPAYRTTAAELRDRALYMPELDC